MTASHSTASTRAAGVVLFLVAGLLLTSFGGLGIVAAPVTLPLLFLSVRDHPTRAFRIAGALVGGLTAVELTWGLLYLVAREGPVASWMLPAVVGLATAYAFQKLGRR